MINIAGADTFEIEANEIHDNWTIAFPKTDVCEIGTQADGATWTGKVVRARQFSRKQFGGRCLEVTLSDVTMSDRPGATYERLQVVLRPTDTVKVIWR